MACELMTCCRFFADKMKDLPKSAQYIRSKLCLDDFQSCSRYQIFKEYGGGSLPPYLDPDDTEEVNKVIACLRAKGESCGNP